MREINCYIPIKVRITGDLGSVQAEQLEETLTLAVARRIALATREMKAREGRIPPPQFHRPVIALPDTLSHDQQADVRALVYRSISRATQKSTTGDEGSPIATRLDIIPASYTPPQHHGRPASMALQTRGRPWIIRKAINFHARIGAFLDFVESLQPNRTLEDKVLYIDQFDKLRWVSLWLVQFNQDYTLQKLKEVLSKRALELSRVRNNQVLAYGLGTTETLRQALIDLDEDNQVSKEIPSFVTLNTRRVFGSGGWVLFASMVLPKIELLDVGTPSMEVQIALKLRDISFLMPPELFEQRFFISWPEYIQELGETPVTLRLQPVSVVKRVHQLALQYLMEQMVLQNLHNERGADFDFDAYYGRLFVLNNSALEKFPPSARSRAEALTDDVTRRLDDVAVAGDLAPNWKAVFAFAVLMVDDESVGTARYRPETRRLTPLLLAKLQGDEDSSEWQNELLNFLRNHFDTNPPETRPAGGTVFEYVLADLESQGQFDGLFDKVERSERLALQQQLVRLALATRYAGHERVRRLLELLQKRVLSRRTHIYRPAEGEIWLERKQSAIVSLNTALGDVDSIYIFEHDDKRLKPDRIPDFREALKTEREELIKRILKGQDTKQYTEEEFLRTVMAAAVQRIHLSEDDFEKVTIQRSIRLLRVKACTVEALPRFFVTFEFVERVKGEGWQSVSKPISEIEDEFEARLIYWQLGRAGEMYEKMGMAITIVGLIAIAWEVGLIAALVEAAGGATAVLVSIAISELIYVIRVVFGKAELSLRGFLEAALDGYLMSLGFNGANFLGGFAARAIGTESLKSVVGGWVAERLIVGVVGGAGTAALATFSHDLINIATGEGGWSDFGTYVRNIALGAAVGIAIEFVGMPVLKSLGRTALESLTDARELAKLIRAEGISAVRWTSLITEGLSNVRARLSVIIGDVAAQGFVKAMSERLTEVGEQLGTRFVSQRVLELAQATLTRTAGQGLEKLLTAAELNPSRALSLFNALADNPQQAVAFLELANGLEQSSIRRVLNSFSASNTAQIQEQVHILLQSGPARESLASFLDLVWANKQQIISEGDSDAVYRLYSRATVPNPLSRSPQEYLDEIAEITQGRPQGAASNIQGNPIRGFHRFERSGADLSAIQERIYLNVKADQAPEVMRFVVRDIVDNTSQVPGVGMAKLTGPGAISGRADAIVIYAENQAAVQNVLERIRSYHTAHPEYFQSTTPPMTNRVMGGVSVGAEPLGVGGRASFGSIRSDLIYDALDQAVFANEIRQQFRERVLTLFQRRGINPEAPQLNLPEGGNP
jgi:HopA1 effector protein family